MPPQAVVVVCDALHVGCVGCYGSDWVATPAVDRLAHDGLVFDYCYPEEPAVGHWWRMGLVGESPFFREQPANANWLQNFAKAGGEVGVSWGGPAPGPSVRPEWLIGAEACLFSRMAAAAQWLLDRRHRPALLWLQCDLALGDWEVPAEFADSTGDAPASLSWTELAASATGEAPLDANRLRDAYAARVRYFDAALDTFLNSLRQTHIDDETLIVVTAEQGFPLGEHGRFGLTHPFLHEERAHVPLVVRVPGSAQAARSHALVQCASLVATLAEHLRTAAPAAAPLPLPVQVRGSATQNTRYVCSGIEDAEYAIGTRHWRLLLPVRATADGARRPRMLYAKPDDRWEVSNVADLHAAVADRLELQLRRHLDAIRRDSLDLLLPLAEEL